MNGCIVLGLVVFALASAVLPGRVAWFPSGQERAEITNLVQCKAYGNKNECERKDNEASSRNN